MDINDRGKNRIASYQREKTSEMRDKVATEGFDSSMEKKKKKS